MSVATASPRIYMEDTAPKPIDSPIAPAEDLPSDTPKKKKIKQAVGIIVIDTATRNVLMMSSRKEEGALVLPRGECSAEEPEEHPERAAIRILLDKAGVSTEYLSRRVGTYTQANKKGKIVAHHWMYEVHEPLLLETWPESDRQRVWVPFEKAIEASAGRKMASLALKNCSLNRTR